MVRSSPGGTLRRVMAETRYAVSASAGQMSRWINGARGVACGILLFCFATTTTAAIGTPRLFDWSMPDRLLVNERASAANPGVPVPRYDPDALMIPADGWAVALDACDVTDATIQRYAWRVDGESVGSTTECRFVHRFPDEGVYQVELRLTDVTGDTANVRRRVTVQDWLIVGLGDSFASGEGNPDRRADLSRLESFGEFLDDVADLLEAIEQLEEDLKTRDSDGVVRRNLIDDLEREWDELREKAARTYLASLPVWTETAPAWGTPEPDFTEIALEGAIPGDAVRCHRSMVSGQARAALAIERADPRTSVTLVHLACSGARIDRGLIGSDNGQDIIGLLAPLADDVLGIDYGAIRKRLDRLGDVPGQIDNARQVVRGREIDAIVVSIGGNDIRFSDLLTECVVGEPCHDPFGPRPGRRFERVLADTIERLCSPATWIDVLTGSSLSDTPGLFPASDECLDEYGDTGRPAGRAAEQFDRAIDQLPARWRALDEKIAATFPGLDRARIYLTEYPDLTRDDDAVYCGWTPDLADADDRFEQLPGITRPEWTWADLTVQSSLRDSIETAAALYQWQFVTRTGNGAATIASASREHGYCARANWIVQLPESVVAQQQFLGAIHPNANGHDNYHDAIFAALMKDFYPPAEPEDGTGDEDDSGESGSVDGSDAPRAPTDGTDPGDDDVGLSGGSLTGSMLLLLAVGILIRRLRYGMSRATG